MSIKRIEIRLVCKCCHKKDHHEDHCCEEKWVCECHKEHEDFHPCDPCTHYKEDHCKCQEDKKEEHHCKCEKCKKKEEHHCKCEKCKKKEEHHCKCDKCKKKEEHRCKCEKCMKKEEPKCKCEDCKKKYRCKYED